MALPTYLMKRNGIYYARIPVPKNLQEQAGKKELWKSLGHRSYSDACNALKQLLLSEVVFMPSKPKGLEEISSPIAMRSIGERQFELERQRVCKEYLDQKHIMKRAGIEEDVFENGLTFREETVNAQIS